MFNRHLRDPKTWGVDEYLKEWIPLALAVQKAVPDAKFGMPDVASDVSWLPKIANRWPSINERPNVTTLSHHYYWGGPPASPNVNIERLLRPSPAVAQKAALAREAATKMNVPFRMTEGNTVYQGGKPGLSDVFAAALWGADYLFELMSLALLRSESARRQRPRTGGLRRRLPTRRTAHERSQHATPQTLLHLLSRMKEPSQAAASTANSTTNMCSNRSATA